MTQMTFCSSPISARPAALALITVIAMSFALPAAAECPDFGVAGAHYPTTISQVIGSPCTTTDGRQGRQECHPDRNIRGLVCEPTQPIENAGSAYPKFLIMTVVYAPPGSAGCANPSTVSYGDGNSVGTTVSSSSSYKWGLEVSANAKGGVFGSAEVGVNFGTSHGSGSGDEMSVRKSELSTISVRGPCRDGIDHQEDQIWLLLGPEVQMTTYDAAGCPDCSGNGVVWSLGEQGEIIWVRVGELTGVEEMRPQVADAFARHGITPEDHLTILNANPFWFLFEDMAIDPDASRFVRVPASFPYLPAGDGSSGNRSYEMTTEATVTSSSESSYEYTVGASLSGSVGFLDFAKVSLSSSTSWTWTSKNSSSDSNSTNTAASVTVGTPSNEYTGPGSIAVYYDTVYKSYLFVAL